MGRGYYGEGSGAIHIQQVRCSGSERNITSCRYINNTVITSHAHDVGVECQQGQILMHEHDAYNYTRLQNCILCTTPKQTVQDYIIVFC